MQLLTPLDVKHMVFDSHTGLFNRRDWYDADQVDDFLDNVADTIRQLAHLAGAQSLSEADTEQFVTNMGRNK